MYVRIVRNFLSTSTKLSKQKVNESAKLILAKTLTAPQLSVCTNQYTAHNYSTNKQSLNKHSTDEKFVNEENESDSDEGDEIDYNELKKKFSAHDYFNEKDQDKLDQILKDNPEKQQLKKIIELELIVLQQDGERVPSKLDTRQWLEVLSLKSSSQRRKFYKYVFITEKTTEKEKKKKAEKRIELEQIREERKNVVPSDEIRYGFNGNFLLRRISNTYMNHYMQWNTLRAMMFGNQIVIDCSYDKYMSNLEAKSCAKQLNELYASNRIHNHAFEIFLTNVNRSDKTMDNLHRYIPILYDKDFPMTITEKSYLEIFDRSKLCYLSSDAPTTLDEYDPETVYIVGAFVDRGPKQTISFSKARREGIRMAKLPLDKHLQFGTSGGRDLTVNQVLNIMLDAQCKSWNEALKHVPNRKLQDSSIRRLEQKIAVTNRRFQNMNDNANNSYNTHSYITNEKSRNRTVTSALKLESYKSPNNHTSEDEVHDYSHAARSKFRQRWNK